MNPAYERRCPAALVVAVVAAALLAVLALAGCGSTTAQRPAVQSAQTGQSSASASVPGSTVAPAQATTSLPTVRVSQLPPEAVATLGLIAAGGPYPYPRDGVVFQNRERLLPSKPSGYYREYTVETPGSRDRGAKRIVAGSNGSRFYTDDHYDSFSEVVAG